MTDWGHVVEVVLPALGSSIPVVLYMMKNKKEAKKDNDERQQKQEERLAKVLTENKYFRAHRHNEKAGVLSRENIDFPPDS